MGGRKKQSVNQETSKPFHQMTNDELLTFCRKLYKQGGTAALSYRSLQRHKTLYVTLYHRGFSQGNLLKELGLEKEYEQNKREQPRNYAGQLRERWTWSRIVVTIRAIRDQQGRLPPPLWFQRNGHAALIHAVYRGGYKWDQLREALGDFSSSNFVESRNGIRWLSHAEASLSNFLYARGIKHKRGERYPDSISNLSDAKYAFYDLHFRSQSGDWVDVEVWGDQPFGFNKEKYARRRGYKEAFNRDNPRFLGIQHEACYAEATLTKLLQPYIGNIDAYQFDKPTDSLIHSTHWSNADELLDFCRALASEMPDGDFPTEEWLRKRGKWSDRSGPTYNTASVYIKLWLGGVRNLRRLMGQESVNTRQRDAPTALAAYKRFVETHGLTPGQTLDRWNRKTNPLITEAVANEASRIAAAVAKYVGSAAAAHEQLGMRPTRMQWDASTALAAYKKFFEVNEITPSQAVDYWYRNRSPLIAQAIAIDARRILGGVKKHYGSIAAVQKELGIVPVKPKR